MEIVNSILANEQVLSVIMSIIGIALTFIIGRAAAAFTLATGITVEAVHRDALHQAVKSGVESALREGPKQAASTLQAHVMQHLYESVPDAMNALMPGDGVIKRLIERYTLEAIGKYKEPK